MFGKKNYQREKKLQQLRRSYERLREVVGELLAQVNEIDVQNKYEASEDALRTVRLRNLCSELVALGDDLPKIEHLIEAKKIKEAQDIVLTSCQTAVDISKTIESIRHG